MCGGFVGDIVKPISNPIKKTLGVSTSKTREAQRQSQQASAVALRKRAKETKMKEQSSTRKQQIEKFGANVARGGAKRASSIGR